jgi:hypothetical protein
MPETQKTCRICLKPFVEYPMGEKNGSKFVACKACGSIETQPWPTQEELDQFFADIQPEIVHFPNHEREIIRIKKLIGKVTQDFKGRRFLDVCSRQGYGVLAAKELGFQAHGIDSHDFFVAFAKDKYDPHLFTHISVQDYAAKNEQAEFIYIPEGFCEQLDPESYVAALAKILAPTGKIYLHEPDGNHLRLPTNFANWGFVDPLLNFSYLSKRGLEALLARHGLKIEKSFWSWSPFMHLVVVHK